MESLEKLLDAVENVNDPTSFEALLNSQIVIINGLTFCKDHGNEFCNKCQTDMRLNNNGMLPKRDLETLSTTTWAHLKDLQARQPISDVFSLIKPVRTGRRHEHGFDIYACPLHNRDSCSQCFNWADLFRRLAKRSNGMIADREQILGLLHAMGASFPADTKLKDDILERKLGSALTASQNMGTYAPASIDPSKLSLWPQTAAGNTSAFDAMGRTSIAETLQISKRDVNNPFPSYAKAFSDARETTMHMVRNYGKGMHEFLLRDKGDSEAICIRILGIHKLNDDTPLISLIYHNATHAAPLDATKGFMEHLVASGYLPQIVATTQEQALFRKILAENSRRISPDFKPKKESYEATFEPSFVVPLNPINQLDIGKLLYNAGCSVCGEKTVSRCSQCQSVSYCGRECQKAHWPEHKSICKSLKGGMWIPLKMVTEITVDGKTVRPAFASNHGPPPRSVNDWDTRNLRTKDAPPNVHGDQPFIIKIQKPLDHPGSMHIQNSSYLKPLLVYDRQRSFSVHALEEDDPDAYKKIVDTILAGNNKMKMYRWAKRVGDYGLTVCLDREPIPEPNW